MTLYDFLAYADSEQEFIIMEGGIILNTGDVIYLNSVLDLSEYVIADFVSADDVIIVSVDHV